VRGARRLTKRLRPGQSSYSAVGGSHRPHRPEVQLTSFLTATTLIYAMELGITAAAGTRLALQLFLVKGFKLYSFQL